MKFLISLFMLSPLFSFNHETTLPLLELNSPIPLADEKLKNVDGKEITLNSIKTSKGILVIFSCNNCPYGKLNEERINQIFEYCKNQGIGFVMLNSNESERLEKDSYLEMINYSKMLNFSSPYLLDVDSKVANAFGALITPECFLFNSSGLIYKGAIDDNVKEPSLVKERYLKEALSSLVKNEKPIIQVTKAIGCSIKRVE